MVAELARVRLIAAALESGDSSYPKIKLVQSHEWTAQTHRMPCAVPLQTQRPWLCARGIRPAGNRICGQRACDGAEQVPFPGNIRANRWQYSR